ncbi:uncharacterized protein N7482_007996 [Penicillium canariense]|uniref:Uncharacterized protein n=1 Tax=Penicillium canariense TaxID=189055 RepID=A0A9W9LH37_9EURO|nr:uncharacterized protein N7482_007996 [Penicillium canariense]KAJ5156896.1 hypothetical protein N7482_007996 [Penicillium canariense]
MPTQAKRRGMASRYGFTARSAANWMLIMGHKQFMTMAVPWKSRKTLTRAHVAQLRDNVQLYAGSWKV